LAVYVLGVARLQNLGVYVTSAECEIIIGSRGRAGAEVIQSEPLIRELGSKPLK